MRNYILNIAGYNIRFESSRTGPEIMPSKKFLRYVIPEPIDSSDSLTINVHRGSKELPVNSRRVFHAPFVEEINGRLVQQSPEFWSIWQDKSDLYIKVVFPSATPGKKALLEFSLVTMKWNLWINTGEQIDPFEYPLDGLILYYLTVINKDIMIHASGIENAGRGYIFSGISGKGKTTISRLWNDHGAKVIHDDRLIIRRSGDQYIMHNTPIYDNDEPLKAHLDRIFIIEHGYENKITSVSGAAAVSLVMSNCIQHNWGIEIIAGLLATVSDMCKTVEVCKLSFRPDKDVIEHIYEYE